MNPHLPRNMKGKLDMMKTSQPILQIMSLGVLLLIAVPLCYVAINVLSSPKEFIEYIFEQKTLILAWNTILLAFSVTLASIFIAVPLAIITIRSNLPLKKFVRVFLCIPLVFPSYIYGFLFILLFGPKGALYEVLKPIGIEQLPELYGFWGAFFCLTLLSYPYIFITVSSSLMKLDYTYEEVSFSLGKSLFYTYQAVIIPLLKPSIIVGAILVTLYVVSDFGAVSLLQYKSFSYVIYNQYETIQRSAAASTSSILILIGLVSIWFYRPDSANTNLYRSSALTSRNPKLIDLGRFKWVTGLIISVLIFLSVILPISVLVYWGFSFTTNYDDFFKVSSLYNSIYASLVGAIFTVLLSIPIVLLITKYKNTFGKTIEKFSYIGFVLPGIVVALAVVYFGINFATPIYQTIILLSVGYIILFIPVSIGVIKPVLLQINPKIEESAKILGASNFKIWKTINLPAMMPGLTGAFAIIFILVMKELPATLILSPLNFDTLATSIWTHATEASFGMAAVYSGILLFLTGLPMFLLLNKGIR